MNAKQRKQCINAGPSAQSFWLVMGRFWKWEEDTKPVGPLDDRFAVWLKTVTNKHLDILYIISKPIEAQPYAYIPREMHEQVVQEVECRMETHFTGIDVHT